MGARYKYECPKCHYEAVVSGEVSQGMMSVSLTIQCRDCVSLYDVAFLERQYVERPGGRADMKFKQRRLRCPENSRHSWDLFTGACPRCSAHLTVDKDRPELLWD